MRNDGAGNGMIFHAYGASETDVVVSFPSAYLEQVAQLMTQFGVAVVHIGAEKEAYAYTVGLAAKSHPELIVFGLSQERAHAVLNRLASAVLSGRRFISGDVVSGVDSSGVLLVGSGKAPARMYPKIANTFFGGNGRAVSLLQVVFADGLGRWPWEPGSLVAGSALVGVVPPKSQWRTRELE